LRNTIISENGTVFSIKDYVNGFEYKRGSASETPNLMQFPFSEGRVLVNNSNSFNYEYFMKDHLGNTRVSFNESAVVQQTNFYYPFGIRITGSVPGDENKYLYNGKELFDDNGLYWYHYGARFYNPQIAQWHTMDPADEFNSPYLYVGNDPIRKIDIDGKYSEVFSGGRKTWIAYNDINGLMDIPFISVIPRLFFDEDVTTDKLKLVVFAGVEKIFSHFASNAGSLAGKVFDGSVEFKDLVEFISDIPSSYERSAWEHQVTAEFIEKYPHMVEPGIIVAGKWYDSDRAFMLRKDYIKEVGAYEAIEEVRGLYNDALKEANPELYQEYYGD